MSVTFGIESLPTNRLRAVCPTTDQEFGSAVGRGPAMALGAEHEKVCEDCRINGVMVVPEWDVSDAFDVNLANANAAAMIDALGVLDEARELVGCLPGEEFAARVLFARVLVGDDSGIRPTEDRQPGRATMIDCGRRPGWWAETLTRLESLAQEAVRLGRDVVWS
jgi:hypothetical protein